ncbi:MAG: gluconate 2-dehydrogenase subunit 3 family protein [Acidobacteria bacterium]|nr:gluconate 2-dehydrogenase subunit 3 family protein [Acidobacteriota bacterium]
MDGRELAENRRGSTARASGGRFGPDLSSEQQIEVLKAIENTSFFELVRTHTVMGFMSNPQYGGNRGKAGWKLIGFEDDFMFLPPFGYYDRNAGGNQ